MGSMAALLLWVPTRVPEKTKGCSNYPQAKRGSSCHVLVGTGATCSVVPKQICILYHQWRVCLTIVWWGCKSSKWESDSLGLVCQFDSSAAAADFLVSDILSQKILLMFNFLSRYDVVVDLCEENYLMIGKTFPLLDLNPTLQRTVVV